MTYKHWCVGFISADFDSLVLDIGGKVGVSPSDFYSCADMSWCNTVVCEFVSITNLMHNFFIPYSYILHYTPRHVSRIVVLIFRRKENCTSTVSGIVTLCKLPFRSLSISARYGSLHSVTIPDTVHVQFSFLLKMSTTMLETCRRVYCNIYD